MPKYWVVGAMYESNNDMLDKFTERGYWELGWDDRDQPNQTARRSAVVPGDRIAVKRMLGQGANEIEIRATGIIVDVSASGRVLFVNWILPNLARRVDSKGCFAAIHGPYSIEDPQYGPWIQEIFCI